MDTKNSSETGALSESWIGRTANIAMHIAAVLLFLTMIAIVLNSGYRYVFGGSLHLILELSGFIFMWLIFLGLAGTYLVGGHVTVELLVNQLSPKMKGYTTGLIVPIVALGYVAMIGWAGSRVTYQLFIDNTLTDGVVPLPFWPALIVMPVGCALLIIALAGKVLQRSWLSHSEQDL